jgi:hypothetical protein
MPSCNIMESIYMYMIIYMYGIMHFLPFCVFVRYVDTQFIRQNTFKEVILHEKICVLTEKNYIQLTSYCFCVEILWFLCLFVCLMVFKATFNNISVLSWRLILLVEETGGPGENHRPVANFIT